MSRISLPFALWRPALIAAMTLAPAIVFILPVLLTVVAFAVDRRLAAYPHMDDVWHLPHQRRLH